MGEISDHHYRYAPMLEKIAAVVIEETPALAKLSDEAFALMKAPIKTGVTHMGTEIDAGQVVGRVFATDSATIAQFPGHSAVQESLGNIHLLSADGAKLHLTPTQTKLELLDGTIVNQEGTAVTTKLPGGDILRQEKLAHDEVVTMLNGKELERTFGQDLSDGVRLSNHERHASSVFLKDGTYLGNDMYGFSLYRGVDPARGWAGGQADITVEARHARGSVPALFLHNPGQSNMFKSNFLIGRAGQGVAVNVNDRWKPISDFLKQSR